MTAELRGAIGSASAQQLYQKKKKEFLSPGRAGGGFTAEIVVMNRAQRCVWIGMSEQP